MEKEIIVAIKENESFTEWLRRELKDQLSKRYKVIHMAEDMNIEKATLYRFINGKEVKGVFYDKAFSYLIQYKK